MDYLVLQLSRINAPDLNVRAPQFVIADDEDEFKRQVKNRLRYLTPEQNALVERCQPFREGGMLGVLRDMTGQSKHRQLLTLRDCTGLDIHFAEIEKQDNYEGYFMYETGEGGAVFARPSTTPDFRLDGEYLLMPFLNAMIDAIESIIRVSFRFFQDRPR